MNKSFGNSDPKLEAWAQGVFGEADALLDGVLARQQAAGMPEIQVAKNDGRLLEVLARVAGAKRAVEIGTLGGYSGVCILRGMGDGGVLHTFEFEDKHAKVAAETFRLGGFSSRAHIHQGDANANLPSIEGEGPFNLVFIDADKEGYPGYLAWAAKHLRVGGMVLGDNAFLFGKVCDAAEGEDARRIRAMQSFNEALARGGRFRATMIPTGEGLAVGVKLK